MESSPESLFAELKRYVRFGPADSAALAAFSQVVAPHFGRIAVAFYERAREHEREVGDDGTEQTEGARHGRNLARAVARRARRRLG